MPRNYRGALHAEVADLSSALPSAAALRDTGASLVLLIAVHACDDDAPALGLMLATLIVAAHFTTNIASRERRLLARFWLCAPRRRLRRHAYQGGTIKRPPLSANVAAHLHAAAEGVATAKPPHLRRYYARHGLHEAARAHGHCNKAPRQ